LAVAVQMERHLFNQPAVEILFFHLLLQRVEAPLEIMLPMALQEVLVVAQAAQPH
jgi:hypothetical protein